MTEQEWLACTEPKPMLDFLRGRTSDRKRRLFAVACCRRIWHLMTDERSRKALELAERSADHPIAPETLAAVSATAEEAFGEAVHQPGVPLAAQAACFAASYASNAPAVRHADAFEVMQAAVDAVESIQRAANAAVDTTAERAGQAVLLRDLWQNPLRLSTLNPAWLTPTVEAVAKAIYEERAFDRIPILADALEDAGCDNQDILAHCRQPGVHVRGCWALDLVLGKE
jgi:hypothetical protein